MRDVSYGTYARCKSLPEFTKKGDNMGFTEEQKQELEALTKKVAEWLEKNADIHTSVIVSADRYEVTQDVMGSPFIF